ncbi:MAG TPA: MBL fold metallo-hydrolase [Gemmatimonadaceae bacterium]|jgi:Predicted exonuclease of the beta-lactamase fold involved in RNA processing
MEIEFSGAAREVTGSCHIIRANGQTILLDCGLFQGRRRESQAKNLRFPLPVDEIGAIVLSHAHMDHAGRLPLLSREGYDKTIWCTAATRDLAAIMLADSAHIQENDAKFLSRHNREAVPPLYDGEDARRAVGCMVSVPYRRTMEVLPGVKVTFTDAGHILGSASVLIEAAEHGRTTRLAFSGDIGRSGLAIIRDPRPPERADAVIMESTYGNRDHESVAGARAHLARVVRDTAARGGRILIPAFAVGRTQELVYNLHNLFLAGEIPRIPIYIDSPLATDATAVFEANPDVFDRSEDLVRTARSLFQFDLVSYTREVEESKRLNTLNGPMVIIAASGMAEGGRILHHLAHGADDPRNTILIVGFMAEHTLGRRIVERRPTIRVFGEDVELRAQVEVINGYSAHADRTELQRWLDAVKATSPSLESVFLVHGEPEAQDAFAGQLEEGGYQVSCPTAGTRVQL